MDAPTARKKHDVHSFIVNKDINQINPYNSNTPLRYYDIQSSIVSPIETVVTTQITNTIVSMPEWYTEYNKFIPVGNATSKSSEIKATKVNEVESWILATPTVILKKREVTDREEIEERQDELLENKEESIEPLEDDASNETLLFKREIIKPEQQPPVQVHIQNITEVR